MAFITLNKIKLKENFSFLDKIFKDNNIKWAIVSKLLCGNSRYIKELLDLSIDQICDSRIKNLKKIKELNPNIETIYIKPPAKGIIEDILKYADISMNTELKTVELLSKEAKKQGKIHKIIIMIELGELREGIMGENLVNIYKKIFSLGNIEVVGLGSNFSCLYGVLPNQDKLIQLSLYKELIEAKFNKRLEYVSGGSSVVIPLLLNDVLPKGINHFRVGETLFLGTNVYDDTFFKDLHKDVFRFYAEIIELIEKPIQPIGEIGTNVSGEKYSSSKELLGDKSYRAIIDVGLLDVGQNNIFPIDDNIKVVGVSSDMIVIDLGSNKPNYEVGDLIEFRLNYLGTLKILNSKYIEKR